MTRKLNPEAKLDKEMKPEFYDLHVNSGKDFKETTNIAERLGFRGICLTKKFNGEFPKFAKEVSKLKKNSSLEIFIGAEIEKELRKNSRKALHFADTILVQGGKNEINRQASECWEVDILCYPERETENKKRDLMNQKNSGLDQIIVKLMSEKSIALEINFSQFFHSQEFLRAQWMGRIKQNILLARKFKVPLIITSGATDKFSLRAPQELIALGESLGMNPREAKDSLTKNPFAIIKKISR